MNEYFMDSLDRVNSEIGEWRMAWVHKKPCKEWEEHEKIHGCGFCRHLVEARYRKFGKKLEQIFQEI